jgi:hypothetical protein
MAGALLTQSIFRGDSARQLVDVMRTKFKPGLIGGIVFFTCSNLFMCASAKLASA